MELDSVCATALVVGEPEAVVDGVADAVSLPPDPALPPASPLYMGGPGAAKCLEGAGA